VSLSVLLLLSSGLTLAADGSTKDQMRGARQKALDAGVTGQKGTAHPYYGTQDGTTVNVPSYEFQGTDPYNDQISDDGNGMRYFRANGSDFLAAPVHLPSGVIIDYVEISDCINTGGDIFLGLWSADYGSGSPGSGTNITFVNTIPGCGVDGSYSLGYSYTSNQGNPLWLLMLWGSTYDGTTKFNDVTVGYHRMVTPAPGSPTFNDVPISDPGFQYIEALVSSGVTAGCGGGNYCPDNPLTRRQMAVFLSKAFGLHWPN
jgi:hypothetical protein